MIKEFIFTLPSPQLDEKFVMELLAQQHEMLPPPVLIMWPGKRDVNNCIPLTIKAKVDQLSPETDLTTLMMYIGASISQFATQYRSRLETDTLKRQVAEERAAFTEGRVSRTILYPVDGGIEKEAIEEIVSYWNANNGDMAVATVDEQNNYNILFTFLEMQPTPFNLMDMGVAFKSTIDVVVHTRAQAKHYEQQRLQAEGKLNKESAVATTTHKTKNVN